MPSHEPNEPGRALVYAPALLMLGLVLFSAVLFNRADEGRTDLRRIEKIRVTTMRAFSELQDAETGQRGYLLTGREDYLAPYLAEKDSVMLQLDELRRMTRDEPVQQNLLAQLYPVVNRRMRLLDSTVAERRAGDEAGALAIVISGRGQALMDSARKIFGQMRRVETRMLLLSEDRERKDQRRLQYALIIGVVLSAIISLLVSNKLANDATRHWLMSAELQSRVDMLKSQSTQRTRTSGETRGVSGETAVNRDS